MPKERLEIEISRLVDALGQYAPGTPNYEVIVNDIERLDMVRDRIFYRELAENENGCSCRKEEIATAVEEVFCTPDPAPVTELEELKKQKKSRKKKEDAPVVEEPVVEEPVGVAIPDPTVEEPVVEEPVAEDPAPVEPEYTFLQIRAMCVDADKSLAEGEMAKLIAQYTPEGKPAKLSAILPTSYPAFVKALQEKING